MPNRVSHQYGYELAYTLAGEQLAGVTDFEQLGCRNGARYQTADSGGTVTLTYLNQSYRVTLPDVSFSLAGSQDEVPMRDRILMLHYLVQAKGTPLTGRMITYKELPEGLSYFPTFFKRAIKPLLDHFGGEPRKLWSIAPTLGGRKAEYGDAAVTINGFDRVPVTLLLWQGDAELAPEGNILFDSTISDYLTTEDINVLCETIAWRLVKTLRAGGH
ncbi:DUF3786 domain-containing protein [Chloroflexota bacterium]